jgi:Tellurite resistance protein TerB
VADVEVGDATTVTMEQIVVEHGRLSPAQAAIVVQIARRQALLFGGTEDYLVTREFRAISTEAERLDLLRCCFLVGAADGGITAEASRTLDEIAEQLDIDRARVHELRAEFADRMTALQAMRGVRAPEGG